MRIKVGIRPSLLAFKQAEEIESKLEGVSFEFVFIATKGDKDKQTPLSIIEDSDFFTREIEMALLCGRIDAAVHSAKDLEEYPPSDLVTAALTKSVSPYDCLVSHQGYNLQDIPSGAVVGTSSKNRKASVIKNRPDIITKDIRGNIDERLVKLDRGQYDAVVMAEAALLRLGCTRPRWIVPFFVISPHLLQGRLAVQIHKKRKKLSDIFRRIHGA
ncbi:MAG: hydroxymethylbilane synthase [Candidatus Omnitrophota bacterium]